MSFSLTPLAAGALREQGAKEILRAGGVLARYGLALTPADAQALAEAREDALRGCGRIEFGAGTVERLIEAFADSPYLSAADLPRTLAALIEQFYALKNVFPDTFPDGALIARMRRCFDGPAGGAPERLEELIPGGEDGEAGGWEGEDADGSDD